MLISVKPLTLPAPSLAPATWLLALDIGGTQIRSALVSGAGVVQNRVCAPTPATDLLPEVIRCARASLAAPVVAVAVSAPGPLDRQRGVVATSANLPDLALAAPLTTEFGLPVVVERDTIVAALAEGTFGTASGVPDFAYVTVSTGIGSAIVAEGRVLTGVSGNLGEIGHFPVDPAGPLCGCGNRGCLEALASGSGIAAAAGTPGSAREIALRALRGDPSAEAVMSRARAAFAQGMVGLVNAYDPGLVVVGGSVARGQGDLYLEPARAAVARHAYGPAARETRILPSCLGDDVGLLGAVPLIALAGPDPA
ncbi:ROK family protein [Nonomuraea sp. NPDC049152]|uniref:ROK family protein n=1 Tax=Nonomuraea sp. NPDC049152 TaxID=3154350 RepID=UPI0033F5ED83